jgi:hypothetical protein
MKINANSRDVVKEVRGVDITKFKLNLETIGGGEKENRRKITVSVDETALE